MNKDKAKRSFVIRTVAAIAAIYVLIVGSVTYYGAKQNITGGQNYSWNVLSNTVSALNNCVSDSSSKGVEDGLDLVRAEGVIYNQDFNLGYWDPQERIDTLFLYRAEKDKEGNITGLKRVISEADILTDSWYSDENSGRAVVLDDWFSPKQIEQMKAITETDPGALIKGYNTGGFFEPVSVQFSYTKNEEDGIKTKADFIPSKTAKGKGLTTWKIETAIVCPVDQTSSQDPDATWDLLALNTSDVHVDKDQLETGFIPLKEAESNIFYSEEVGITPLMVGDYFLGYSIIDHPLAKTIRSSLFQYFIIALICILIGLVLVGSYCRSIDAQYEAERKRRRMSDAMAHEMKTPLGIIKNYSEVLLEEEDSEKRGEYLNTIIEETDSMNAMVVSMLDLSKMEAGTYPLELSMISLTDITKKVVSRTKILAQRKNIQIEMDSEEDQPILADEKLVTQSICNLVLNAVAYGVGDSKVRISIENRASGVRFVIHNQGEPIPEKERARIWDSFYRGDSSRNRQSGGTGLGLAIVKNTSMLHRGTCGCENEEGGVGFWMEVPDQENKQKSKHGKIGPIIHTEDSGLNLSGLIYGLVGSGIWLLINAYVFILRRHEFSYDPRFAAIPWIISISGWILCWVGARKLKFLTGKMRLANLAAPVALVGVATLCLFSEEMQLSTGLYFQMVLLMLAAGAGLYLAYMFLACKALADRVEDRGLKKIAVIAAVIELVSLALWSVSRDLIWLIAGTYSMGNVITGITFIAILGNLYLWYHIYRKYHGKEI